MNRRTVLGGALTATLVLVTFVAAQDGPADDAIVDAAVRPKAGAASIAAAPQLSAISARSAWPEPAPAALAAWSPPLPPLSAPPSAPRPAAEAASALTAPPFPYQWFGSLVDGGAITAMLGNEQRSLVVRTGDMIDAQWRVERIADRRIDLVWLPTGQAVPLVSR